MMNLRLIAGVGYATLAPSQEGPDTMPTIISEIIAKLEKINGPDRALDADIAKIVSGPLKKPANPAPNYTGSQEAGFQLVEHVLDIANVDIEIATVSINGKRHGRCSISGPKLDVSANAATAEAALCMAALLALVDTSKLRLVRAAT